MTREATCDGEAKHEEEVTCEEEATCDREATREEKATCDGEATCEEEATHDEESMRDNNGVPMRSDNGRGPSLTMHTQ